MLPQPLSVEEVDLDIEDIRALKNWHCCLNGFVGTTPVFRQVGASQGIWNVVL